MAMTQERLKELALKGLKAELQELELSIGIVRESEPAKEKKAAKKAKREGRLSAAGRAAISAAMKARWAAKRKAKG